jgi:hypothetical protein
MAVASDRYDPTAASGAPSWTIPERFLTWEINHHRFELKRLLGKGEWLARAVRTWRARHLLLATHAVANYRGQWSRRVVRTSRRGT